MYYIAVTFTRYVIPNIRIQINFACQISENGRITPSQWDQCFPQRAYWGPKVSRELF